MWPARGVPGGAVRTLHDGPVHVAATEAPGAPAEPAPEPAAGAAAPAGGARPLPLAVPAVVLAVLAGIGAIGHTFGRGLYVFTGDQAVLALGVHDALGLHAQLGPYSRFGWSHPGPALSYVLAPFYGLLGHNPRSLFVGVLAVNGGALVATVAVVRHMAGEWAARWAAAVLGVFVLAAGTGTLLTFWNPSVVAAPLLLALTLAAACARGSWLSLVGLAVVGSYCVQTDVGTGPTVAAASVLGACALALGLWRRRGRRPREPWRRAVAVAVGGLGVCLLAAMWAPPLHQQLSAPQGNLAALWDFFRHPTGLPKGTPTRHRLPVALGAIATTASPVPLGGDATVPTLGTASAGRIATVAVSAGVAALAALVALVRRRAFALGLAAATLGALAAEVWSATRVVGPLYPYLVSSATFVAVPGWVAAGALVADALGRRWAGRPARWPRRLGAAVVAGALLVPVVVLAVQFVAQAPGAGDDGAPPVGALAAFARAHLPAGGAGSAPLVQIDAAPLWPVAAGLIWQLTRDGLHPVVSPQWGFMFGAGHVARGAPRVELELAAPAAFAASPSATGPRLGVTTPFGPAMVVVHRVAGAQASRAP